MTGAMAVQELREAIADCHPMDKIAITIRKPYLDEDEDEKTVPLDTVKRIPSTYGCHVELVGGRS